MPTPRKPLLQRQRRPSDLKRLVESQARLLGAAIQAESELQEIEQRLADLRQQHSKLTSQLAALRSRSSKTAERIRALYPELDPSKVEPVMPLPRTYGGHGSLIATIREAIDRAAPNWVCTNDIVDHVIKVYGLQFATGAERKAWRTTAVRNKLIRMCEAGELERRSGGTVAFYRRVDSARATTLDELAAITRRALAEPQGLSELLTAA